MWRRLLQTFISTYYSQRFVNNSRYSMNVFNFSGVKLYHLSLATICLKLSCVFLICVNQRKRKKSTKIELNEQRMKKNCHWVFWKFYDSFITSDRNSEKEKSIFIFTVLFGSRFMVFDSSKWNFIYLHVHFYHW